MEYSQLKSAITSVIKENGNEEITGQLMQDALIAIINALGLGFQFMGKATPATDPGTPDARVFYIAFESGLYSNFGGVTLDGKSLVLFLYSTNWSTITIDVPTSAVLTDYLKIADLAVTTGQGTNTSMTQKAITDALDGKVDKVTGKGLSTNDFTNALKTLVENSIQQSKIVQELGDDATAIISQAAMTIILAGYAKIDGYYQSLTAGAAENLVGRGSVPASFLRRTTGGTADIGTGSAKITKLMGNSIVWNQLFAASPSYTNQGVTFNQINGHITGSGTSTGTSTSTFFNSMTGVVGHKYLFHLDGTISGFTLTPNAGTYGTQDISQILTATDTLLFWGYKPSSVGAEINCDLYLYCIDLTLMFGAGNEPVTVEAFEALFRLPYYAPNPGVVLPFAAQKLVTTGFNQWDEEWELGGYNNNTGEKDSGTDRIRSKNAIPIFPNTNYYINGNGFAVFVYWYGADGSFISYTSRTDNTITSPSNAYFMRIRMTTAYGTTYNHDICINLSWSGIRNGEYEPYEKHEAIIDPANWSDTDGNDVYPFGGMHGVGIARDYATPDADGFIRKAIRVFGRVDLGSLNWAYTAEAPYNWMVSDAIAAKADNSNIANFITKLPFTHYSFNTLYNAAAGENGIAINASGKVIIRDSAYTDAAAFKAAMSGVYLYYELAIPVEIELATPVAVSYYANDWGTEAWEPENTDVPYTAPCDMLIAYAMNAVDTLRRLPENYISTGSFENFCTELATKLGAALNKTITITPTYNDTTQEYTFAISIVDAG